MSDVLGLGLGRQTEHVQRLFGWVEGSHVKAVPQKT